MLRGLASMCMNTAGLGRNHALHGMMPHVRRGSNVALVLSSKNWKNIQDGGQHQKKTNPKSLRPVFFHSAACRRVGIDAALVRALIPLL